MKKDDVLKTLVDLLSKNKQGILDANQKDLDDCGKIDESMMDRLKVDDDKIHGMIAAVEQVIKAGDPENKVLYSCRHENGMRVENRSVPFGKILIIYESRPDVTIEASALAFKAGNKILLKGGKESRNTNLFLVSLWKEALSSHGVDQSDVVYLDLDRQKTQDLIKNNSHQVDLIIPRGGEGLINFVKNNTDIPIIVSGRGNNFLYVDQACDFEMATSIILNGKSRVSVCNALDKVLIHKDLPDINSQLERLVVELKKNNIQILADQQVGELNDQVEKVEGDEILSEEFLSSKIYLAIVSGSDEAIQTINQYSGGHSACIVTSNSQTAEVFQNKVDCAGVYHNASTRFTDGGQFGFGAEIAISTQKLHFRGPIGIEQLVTNKWFVYGEGQVR